MTIEKRLVLNKLVLFVDLAYKIPDINEQYRDWKQKNPDCAVTQSGKEVTNNHHYYDITDNGKSQVKLTGE